MKELKSLDKSVMLAVLVAALGYFVDIYDLLLFSIVRVNSLKSLGIPEDQLLEKGVLLINVQMAGLLLGGIIWGVLGDKRGRLSVLFGSIFLYSVANLLNGFVQTVDQYVVLRFIAGIGLAGELGAGVTLVAEMMPRHLRGYGTSFIASVGIMGAVVASLTADFFDWRVAYFVGGGLGFLVLLLRVGVTESGLFHKMKNQSHVVRGNFLSLFQQKDIFLRYLCVILVGVPLWYIVGILVTFSPEFGRAMGMTELPSAGKAVLFCYLGASFSDFFSGLLSQWVQSRRKVILYYLIAMIFIVAWHFSFASVSMAAFYFSCALLGVASGYWAIFVTVAAEQFGTNIRSTVATTAPNFVRGAVIPLALLFQSLAASWGVIQSGIAVGALTIVIAFISLYYLEETFHKDLDYLDN